MKISENELAVIFMIDHLASQGNFLITKDHLALKMNLDHHQIDVILAGLYTKGFINYVTQGNKTTTSLDPLKEKLFREFQMTTSFEQAQKNSKQVNDMIQNVFGEFEKLLSRPLTQVEFSRIRTGFPGAGFPVRLCAASADCRKYWLKTLRSQSKHR